MTAETKTFIELDDIAAIQLRCKKCGATISRPVSESSKPMRECPSCQTLWMEHGTAEEKRICNLAVIIENAKQVLEGRQFALLLEIRQSASQTSTDQQ